MTRIGDEGQRETDQIAILKTLLAEAHRKLAEAQAEVERLRAEADDD